MACWCGEPAENGWCGEENGHGFDSFELLVSRNDKVAVLRSFDPDLETAYIVGPISQVEFWEAMSAWLENSVGSYRRQDP